MVHIRKVILSLSAVAVVVGSGLISACGGAAPTAEATPRGSTDPLTQWEMNGPISTTCGGWKSMPSADQTQLASTMLTTIRSLDPPANKQPASAAQVETLRSALVSACTAGSDCTDPDRFCDTDRITFAAYAEYAVHMDELRQ